MSPRHLDRESSTCDGAKAASAQLTKARMRGEEEEEEEKREGEEEEEEKVGEEDEE